MRRLNVRSASAAGPALYGAKILEVSMPYNLTQKILADHLVSGHLVPAKRSL
jgi:hypothetical protein